MNNVKRGDILVLVGTRKGVFILRSNANRKNWQLSEPYLDGNDIFHVVYDQRGESTLWAVMNNPVFGSEILRSTDFGITWHGSEAGPQFKPESELTLSRIWHFKPGRADEPHIAYLGVEPASLFKTENGGDSWSEIDALTSHPSRNHWAPGFGGLCLHSIILDESNSNRMWVGISSAGVFGTQDNGATWKPMNNGVRADFMPEIFPEVGQCPHKVVAHPAEPDTLYQQNHCGFFRTDDGGKQWIDLSEGLSSRFGLVATVNSQDPDTVYVLPEDRATGDELGGGVRYVTDAKFRVFRSRNRGNDWEPITKGLPQRNAYLHALRDGMATDDLDPCGVYIGTTTGQIFYSRDNGDSWELMIDYLPPINSIETAIAV